VAKKRAKARKSKYRRRLTPRRVKFVEQLVLGKSLTDAAKEAGYSKAYPGQAGHQALEQIQKNAPELLAKHGLTDDVLIEKYLIPQMNAEKTEFFPYTKRGQRKLLSVNVVDWRARDAGLEKAMKIRGLYVKEAENTGPTFSVVILNAENRPPWSQMKRANAPQQVQPPSGT
jgi:hypothetical protein